MTPEEYRAFLEVYQGKRFTPEFAQKLKARAIHAVKNDAEHVFVNPDDGYESLESPDGNGRDYLRHKILFGNHIKPFII